jgi:hypothetical protein
MDHNRAVELAGKERLLAIVGGRIQPGNRPVDLISGNGTQIEVKTSLSRWFTNPSIFSEPGRSFPFWRWKGIPLSKPAKRLILIGSARTINGKGPFIQRPRFFDLDYRQVAEALKSSEEIIQMRHFGGHSFWNKLLAKCELEAEDLKRDYGRQ